MPSSPPRGSTTHRGRAAEEAAAALVVSAGLRIVQRNFSAAGAELDLVALEHDDADAPTYVFIEVRSRASSEHGSAVETVDRRKQRRVIRAATAWLVQRDLWERVEVRFDVIGVALDEDGEPRGTPHWIRDAFQAEG
ncbi:MAG: YraN family protein [Myxococcota bacterium]